MKYPARILVPLFLAFFLIAGCGGYVGFGVGWGGWYPDYPWCCWWPYDWAALDAGTNATPDLFVTNDQGEVYRLASSSARGFETTPTLVADLGDGPRRIATGDVDGDGLPDLAVVDPAAATLDVYLLGSDGALTPAPAGQQALPVESDVREVHLLDADSDGRADLLLREATGRIQILSSLGDGSFTPIGAQIPTPSAGRRIVVGRFDDRPANDFLVVDAVDRQTTLYAGVGDGTFEMRDPVPLDLPGSVIFDLAALPSADGDLTDLVVLLGASETGPATIVRYANRGDALFVRVDAGRPVGTARRLRPFPVSGSRLPDLLLLDPEQGTMRVLRSLPSAD